MVDVNLMDDWLGIERGCHSPGELTHITYPSHITNFHKTNADRLIIYCSDLMTII